jgi:hypothetical protein
MYLDGPNSSCWIQRCHWLRDCWQAPALGIVRAIPVEDAMAKPRESKDFTQKKQKSQPEISKVLPKKAGALMKS